MSKRGFQQRVPIATLAFIAALMAAPTVATAQTNGTWTSTTGGMWGDSANWSGGTVADGTGATANFSTLNISGVQTVTLNAPVTSGTLLFGDATAPAGGWTLTGGTLSLATVSGVPTISVTGLGNATVFGNQAARISSVIAGSNGLNKSGSSALVLSAANTYSGVTTVNGGFLVLDNASALGNSSSVTVSSGVLAIGNGITIGAGKSLTNNSGGNGSYGGVAAISGGTGTWAGSLTLGSGARVGYEQNSLLVLSGSLGGSNGLIISGLDVSGSRTSIDTRYAVLVTATNNGYTGTTDVARGVLKIGADNALPTATTLNIRTGINANEAAGFDLNGFNQTVGVLSSSGITAGSGAVTANASAFLTNSSATTGTFTANQNSNTTFRGMITGNLAFVKSGAGNLTLEPTLVTANNTGTTGTSTFSGDTFVSAGTLTLGNANALFGSMFDTASTGTLSLGTLSAATVGGLKNSGTFTLTNSGSAFTLSVGGNHVSSTFTGRLTGLGGLTKVGSGTLTLTGATSDYAGATTLAGGALALGSVNALPTSGAITFSGGALQYTASNTTDYTARIASSGSAVSIDTNGQNVTFIGGIDATNMGGLRKLGSGTLTLSGSSGYSGATTLSGGVLALDNANSLPSAGNVTFTGGALRYSASNTSDLASRVASSTSAIAIDTAGQSVTWAGNIASTNTGGLTKTGAGALTLSGSNTFTGVVTVTGGTLAVSGTAAFPTGVTGVTLNGGAIQAAGSASLNVPGGIPSGATVSLGASGGTLVNSLPSGMQWFISAPIVGGAGTGPLSLSGTSGEFVLNSSSSSYSGGTILSNPQVAINADSSLGTGTITFAGGGLRATSSGARSLSNPVTISAGASFYGSIRDVTLAGPITLTGSTQTVTVTGTSVNAFNGSVGDGGAVLGLVKSGAGILVLGGANTYTGTTTFAAGTLRVANTDALAGGGNLTFTGGALQYSGSNAADYSPRIVGSSGPIAIDTNGQSVSFASALAASNSGGLTKSGPGTLTLAANNAFTGLTTVSGGTLQLGNGGTAGSIAGNVTLSSTSGLVFNRSDSFGYSGSISGTGSITKLGAGTLSLSGNNVITGVTTIAGGTLSITGTGALPGIFTLDGGTLVNATGASSFGKGMGAFTVGPGGGAIRSDVRIDPGSTISGTSPTALLTYGPVTTGSTGILLVISGNNTYAANTKVEAGMFVVVDNNNAFGTGTLELAGAAIRSRAGPPRSLANAVTFSGNTQFSGVASDPNLTFTGTALLAGGTRTFQVDNVITSGSSAGQPGVIFANTIGDGGNGSGITKTGAGVLALGGANTFSGATTLTAGTLQLQNQNALQHSTLALSGTGGVIFDAAVAANAFTLGGLSGANAAATLALQNSAATAITLTVGSNGEGTSYAGSLTGAGSLEKIGSGSLVLAGLNTFAGPTTITAGTLQIGGGGTAGSLGGNVVNNAALVFNRSDASSYGGGISGSGSLTKAGAGTLTLSGSNDYAGPTTLAGGMLALAGANSLPSSGDVAFTGGSLQYSGAYTADLSARIIGSSGAVAIDTNGQAVTFATGLAASNVGGLRKSGAGTLTLSAANAFTGPVTLAGGVLAVDNADALPGSGAFTFTGGTLRYSASYLSDLSSRIVSSTGAIAIDTNGQHITFAAAIGSTNTAGLTKSGAGTLTLSGSNTYGGTTAVSAGTLAFTTDAAMATLPGDIALDGGVLAYTGTSAANVTTARPISLGVGGGTLRNTGSGFGFWFVPGAMTGSGPLTVASGSSLIVIQGANTYSGGTTLEAGSATVVGVNSIGPAGAPTSGAFGTGTVTLAGGGLRSTTGAARTVGNALSVTADTTFFSAGTSDDKSITFTGPVTLSGGSRSFTVDTTGTGNPAIIFSGVIGDGGNGFGLTKAGAGSMIFTAANTYTGSTVVSNGTLVVNGDQSAATGAMSIASIATLMGSGTIGGATTVAGLHSPGNSPGIQTFAGDLTYSGGSSTVIWELAANTGSNSPVAFDRIVVGGNLDFTGPTTLSLSFNTAGSTVNWTDSFWDTARTWTLYSVTGTTTGFGNLSLAGSPASWLDTQPTPQSLTAARPDASFSIVQDGSNVNVVYAIVPEPGALALAAIGIAAAAWARRRPCRK